MRPRTCRVPTPLGEFLAEMRGGILLRLRFPSPRRPARFRRLPPAPARVTRAVRAALSGRPGAFLRLDRPAGTSFQRAVWREIARIPRGKVRTYGEIARRLGRPSAARAVGAACGANPVPVLVPCHRVVAAGGLGGFGGGLAWKRRLLALESALLLAAIALSPGCRFPAWGRERPTEPAAGGAPSAGFLVRSERIVLAPGRGPEPAEVRKLVPTEPSWDTDAAGGLNLGILPRGSRATLAALLDEKPGAVRRKDEILVASGAAGTLRTNLPGEAERGFTVAIAEAGAGRLELTLTPFGTGNDPGGPVRATLGAGEGLLVGEAEGSARFLAIWPEPWGGR